MNVEAVLPVVAVLLGAGELAQRHEDRKTTRALWQASPWDDAEAAQAALAAEKDARFRKSF